MYRQPLTDLHRLEFLQPTFRWTIRRAQYTRLHVRDLAKVCSNSVRSALRSEGAVRPSVAATMMTDFHLKH